MHEELSHSLLADNPVNTATNYRRALPSKPEHFNLRCLGEDGVEMRAGFRRTIKAKVRV